VLLAAAIGISLVSIGDTISTSGGFAARSGYEVNGNQELAGIGSANLAAGLFSGFPVSTSGSRTAVASQSGAKTQLTGLVAASLVLLMLLFVPGLVQAMPQPVLAAVIIAASLSLFDVVALRRLYGMRTSEFALAVACGLGVAFIGVLQGIVIAVALSAMYIFKRAWSPYATVLGKAPGVPGYHDIRRYPDAVQVPGLLIVRWSAPLFFANANEFRDRIRQAVKTSDPPPSWILVAAEPITDVDTTAGAMLADLDLELNASGIHLAFAELQSSVRDDMGRYGLLDVIEEGHFYRSVTEAVNAYRREVAANDTPNDTSNDTPKETPA
jgi:MFS superfamily sulfate permease-like transporter